MRLSITRRRGALPREIVLRLDIEREDDGRWIAELIDIPGVMAYGNSREEAKNNVALLALRVIDERRAHGEPLPQSFDILDETSPHLHIHA